jgi:hypothetical protein
LREHQQVQLHPIELGTADELDAVIATCRTNGLEH